MTSSMSTDLLNPEAYPHAVASVELIETHMSWVFLAGEYAYKVKKPVHFEFADFSSLAQRSKFCQREIELNRRFAPELDIGVVPLIRSDRGYEVTDETFGPATLAPGETIVEWAVKMWRFPTSCEARVLLNDDQLTAVELYQFGQRLAAQHQDLPVRVGAPVEDAILENYETPNDQLQERLEPMLNEARQAAQRMLQRHTSRIEQRRHSGKVRECHGDLHLSNLVRIDGEIVAFDCLEFSPALSTIDVCADIAFLFMDLCYNTREDLAFAFIDGYLEVAGDYDGVTLLNLFATYRAGVRAKVAGLRYTQTGNQADVNDALTHLRWGLQRADRPPGRVLMTYGLSGSGKSYWSAKLVSAMGAIRIRSDVLRKTSAGLAVDANTNSDPGKGLYTQEKSAGTYKTLAQLATAIALEGELVIVDAASLRRSDRQTLVTACQAAGVAASLIVFSAAREVLEARIVARNKTGVDPSEADIAVLDWQIEHLQPPTAEERPLFFETEGGSLEALLALID